MSRSRKKAIYKDKGIRPYWRHVRRSINNAVRDILHLTDKEDYNIPNPREVVNDYDYSDYTFDCEYKRTELKEWRDKLTRK
jgi:hypothetical protein